MSVVSKGLAASLLGFSSALLCWHCGFSASTIPEEQKIEDEFPTLPAFLVPVEVRDVPEIGPGHKGVFALTDLEKGTVTWKWTDLVHTYHHDDLPAMLEAMEKNSSRVVFKFSCWFKGCPNSRQSISMSIKSCANCSFAR